MRVGAPIARPSAVVCIGMNYAAHAAEMGAQPPDHPVMFFKAPNTVVGPYDDAMIPRGSTKTDWEVEPAVVIGRRAGYLESPSESLAHVAGFATANDLSERRFQLEVSGGQWSKGKVSPGFSPLGPWLVTPDEVSHQDLALRSWVNGEIRQDSSSADQIFDVATVVHHLSQFMTLEAGDLLLTGTPQGVALSGRFPYLVAGDVVEVEVGGLGRQRQTMVPFRQEFVMTLDEHDGLVAVVTGGASGIGAAVAAELQRRGARVAALDLDCSGAPDGVLGLTTDVCDDASVRAAIHQVVSTWGRIDVLVNNAGIVRVSRAALPHLRRSPSAAIVNMCSVAATAGLPQRALQREQGSCSGTHASHGCRPRARGHPGQLRQPGHSGYTVDRPAVVPGRRPGRRARRPQRQTAPRSAGQCT